MSNIERGSFNAVSPFGKNPIKSGEEVLFYAYSPVNWIEQGLRKDVIVAKLPDYPNQVVIGPRLAVKNIAKAFNILDSLCTDRLHRQLNIITSVNFDTDSWSYRKWNDGNPVSSELLETFGIVRKMKDSIYKPYTPGNSVVGVFADITEPIFLSPDYTSLGGVWGEDFVPLYWASVIQHETTHVLQVRNSLPANSLWAERHAMRDQVDVLFKLLNSGKFKKETELSIVGRIKNLMIRSQDYRNGKGYGDHVINNVDGSPTKNQNFFEQEIEFGY